MLTNIGNGITIEFSIDSGFRKSVCNLFIVAIYSCHKLRKTGLCQFFVKGFIFFIFRAFKRK